MEFQQTPIETGEDVCAYENRGLRIGRKKAKRCPDGNNAS